MSIKHLGFYPLFLALALISGVLFSLVLPLWEGFDEPFHYGYVQQLSTKRDWPVMGQAKLSEEIASSLTLAPISRIPHDALPGSISFEEWSQLEPEQRRSRLALLKGLSPQLVSRSPAGQTINRSKRR